MKINQCFWSHDWSEWKETERGNLQRTHDKAIIGNYIVQERSCNRCKFKQLDKQKIYIS